MQGRSMVCKLATRVRGFVSARAGCARIRRSDKCDSRKTDVATIQVEETSESASVFRTEHATDILVLALVDVSGAVSRSRVLRDGGPDRSANACAGRTSRFTLDIIVLIAQRSVRIARNCMMDSRHERS